MGFLKRGIVVALFVSITVSSFGQKFTEFSKDSESFFGELAVFFATSSKEKELKKFQKDFEKFWYGGKISDEEKKRVISRSTDLRRKYGKPYPHFLAYLSAVQMFFEKSHPMESYNEWDKAVKFLIMKKGMTKTLRFIDGTNSLLEKNEIFVSSTATWRALRLNSFTYEFDGTNVKVKFPTVNLVCVSAKNEFGIYDASGTYYPFDLEWHGTSGKTTWERSQYNTENVFAELQNYKIDMKKNYFKADSVLFTNKDYDQERILGSLHDKTVSIGHPDKVSYPKFQSYQQIFEIKEIYPGINYRGGFTMNGSRFVGSGTEENPATLRFVRADSTIAYCRSVSYIFKKESVIGRNTAVSIYIGQDSIYHPGLLFKYDVIKRELSLVRNEDTENMSRSPYFNSYHMIDMDFPQLTWKIDNPKMEMGGIAGSSINNALFESSNYFRESRYNEIGMNDRMHPLIALKRLSTQKGEDNFTVSEFANYLRIPPIDAIHLCLDLSFRGIITYDKDNQRVYLKKRVDEYLNARVGKIDYDVIQFNSNHDAKGMANATLDLTDLSLEMLGVSKVQVSDSQNVVFYPRGSQLTMSKNRDFKFDGKIEAGLFTFYGRGFDFSYDNFKIGLKNVDSLKIKVESFELNQYGVKPLVEIKNSIEYVTGDILIDDPNNKSSIKDFPQYPVFNSEKPSFVFYNYPSIYGGVYDKERFKYVVDPFTIDSINSFSTASLSFKGELISANIFEPIREPIIVQPDYSFGFTIVTGSAGLPTYKGKGTFTDTINLSNKGLQGFGKIDYLNTHTESSKGFIFFPDSVNGFADTYNIKSQSKAQGSEYPEVNGEEINIHWEPYKDKWVSTETGKAFKMYGDTTTLQGSLTFTPEGLGGAGRYQFNEAVIESNSFTFKEKEVLAEESNFDLLNAGKLDEMAFQTKNVNSYINFDTKKATFKANGEKTMIQFPKNKYVCYLKQFTWNMETKEIELGDPDALAQPNAEADILFRSRLMSQDTISFNSPYAKYDLDNNIIDAHRVPYIDVADSRILPHRDSIVTIFKEARLDTIRNAGFLANRENKYHKMYNGTFNIHGKLDYSGNAYYDYVDETKSKQKIYFSYIGVDTNTYRTVAQGKIAEQDGFKLSPNYDYYGNVKMNAWEKHLTFDGATKLANECNLVTTDWFRFQSQINPDSIFIPVTNSPLGLGEGDTLASSLYLGYRPTEFYTGFFSKKKHKNDSPLLETSGYLFFDKNDSRYKIGSKEKIKNNDIQGNLITYHKQYCSTYGEGNIDLGVDLGQVKVGTYGTVNHNIKSNRVTMEAILTVDFMFDAGIMKDISDTLANKITLKPFDLNKKTFKKNVTLAIGEKESKTLEEEFLLYGGKWRKLPEGLDHTITFSSLNLVWDTLAFAYRSVGQFGVLSMAGQMVNKMVNGYVEIAKHYNGDMITIYFNLKDKWYFFQYNNGTMEFIASEDPFNLALDAVSETKRTMQVSKDQPQYKYELSSQAVKNVFVDRFKFKKGYINIMPPLEDEEIDGFGDEDEKRKKNKSEEEDDEYDEYDDEW